MRPQRIGNCADHSRRQLRRARTVETIVPAVISCEPPPNLQGFGAPPSACWSQLDFVSHPPGAVRHQRLYRVRDTVNEAPMLQRAWPSYMAAQDMIRCPSLSCAKMQQPLGSERRSRRHCDAASSRQPRPARCDLGAVRKTTEWGASSYSAYRGSSKMLLRTERQLDHPLQQLIAG
jgi:hypothetical protein